ncbi:MAG: hypothetical protein ACJATT_000138, partial [Myxococcota bacterium]
MDVPLLPAVLLAPRPSGRLPMWTLLLSLAFATPLADSPLAECSAVARTEDGAPAMLATGICAWERGDPAGALVALGQ